MTRRLTLMMRWSLLFPQLDPYLSVRTGDYKGNDRFEGFIPDFLKALKDRKAIPEYTLQLVKDGRFGYFDNEQGRWVGMIGEVMKQGVKVGFRVEQRG